MEQEQFDFSRVEIKEIPVTGPDNKHYVLREASGKVAREHKNALLAATQFESDGKGRYRAVGLRETASADAKFVAGCLWNEDNKNPTYTLIESWPDWIQQKLYRKAKEISRFSEKDVSIVSLKSALSRPGSPISLEDLKNYIKGLGDDYSYLKRALLEEEEIDEEEEEQVKNSPSDTTDGSL